MAVMGVGAASASAATYTVHAGDTLHGIAAAHHESTANLLAANRKTIGNPNLIQPGEHLTLPGSASKTPAKHSTASSGKHATHHTGGSSIVAQAHRYLGVPYSTGGTSSSGMDCSGLVYRVMENLGHHPPRTAAAQQSWATPISRSQAKPGDLVFWGTPAHHDGIYIGNGKMIVESVPGTSAHVQHLYGSPTFGRVP
jgi:cell wall-associated NlpC family hydrolase